MDFSGDFYRFGGRAWINCAHQGPLPRDAVAAAHEALLQKADPHRIPDEEFFRAPLRLKALLGRLIGVPAEEVILGNSATYGLHLLVNGLSWRLGDEVLLLEGDFPATTMPWTPLRSRGVALKLLDTGGRAPAPDDVAGALGPRTRVLCASWVNSFTGHALDLRSLGAVCRDRGVLFVVNGSQGIGTLPLSVEGLAVDAVTSCGYKWLCGPYGTGFAWIGPRLLDHLEYDQAYWLAARGAGPLDSMRDQPLEPPRDLGAARYDVFCTANFLNFAPWEAALRYLLRVGMAAVASHDRHLVDCLVNGLTDLGYRVLGPAAGASRSTLVLASHPDPDKNASAFDALQRAGVDISLREGLLRFSPHLHNHEADIDRALVALQATLV